MNNFYYDYFSLRGVDIPKWHDEFFWPVPRETTTRITFDIKASHTDFIDQLGHTFEGDCLLISYLTSSLLIQIVNHYLSLQLLKNAGYQIVYSEKLSLIPLLLNKDYSICFKHENLWGSDYKDRIIGSARNTAQSLILNSKRKNFRIYHHFDRRNRVFSFPDINVTDRNYTKSIKEWVYVTSPEQWLGCETRPNLNPGVAKKFKSISDDFCSFMVQYLNRQFNLQFTSNLVDAVFNYISDSLKHNAQIYLAIQKKINRVRPKCMLTPTAGKTFTRAISLAVKNVGGQVTGFPHGYYICHYSSPRPALHELSTIDSFMAYSPGSVPLIERNLKINPPARGNKVKILHDNSRLLKDVWHKWRRQPLAREIKTVMILELSLIPEWAGYHAAENLVNYHFYYTLCKKLSACGYNIIFKKRPKSLGWDGFNIFSDIPNMTTIHELFEEPGVIEQADAIIIQYAMSSTLFYSMCTNKTIIYVDAGWEPWFSDVYKLMQKRCRILHCWYDERNRTCFNEDELMALLSKPPETPNTEFMEKYLFPE